MTMRLDVGSAELVAGGHDEAAERIDASATGAPGRVDAGYGTTYVVDILAAVTQTAAEIAVINIGVAMLVRDVVDDLGLTESAVGEQFDAMARLGE